MEQQVDFLNSVYFKRRSIRAYRPEMVPNATLDLLIKAFFQVESARNQMPTHLVVVKDKTTIAALASAHHTGKVIIQAPVVLAITSGREHLEHPTRTYLDQDAGASAHQLLLAAESLGLGALWCGVNEKNRQALSAALALPEDVHLVMLILVGFKAEEHPANNKFFPDRVHYEKW